MCMCFGHEKFRLLLSNSRISQTALFPFKNPTNEDTGRGWLGMVSRGTGWSDGRRRTCPSLPGSTMLSTVFTCFLETLRGDGGGRKASTSSKSGVNWRR